MANQITGRIEKICDIQEIPSKSGGKSFFKREIIGFFAHINKGF